MRREMVAQSGNNFFAEHVAANLMAEGVDAEGDLLFLCFLAVGVACCGKGVGFSHFEVYGRYIGMCLCGRDNVLVCCWFVGGS